MKNENLFIFVDESGNMDFEKTGTQFFVFSAVCTDNPLISANCLQNLKYQLLAKNLGGNEFQDFHATEDRQEIRNEVLNNINLLNNIKVYYLIAKKSYIHPEFRTREKFYSLLGKGLAQNLFQIYKNYKKIIIIFDKTLTNKEEKYFLGEIKPVLKKIGINYAIYFHRIAYDFNGQISDYCAWAKYVSLERSEFRPLRNLNNIKMQEFEILENDIDYGFS